MEENSKHEALKTEIERENYTRAAYLAASLHLADNELKRIQYQALWHMAAIYRNAHGTKALAQQYGYSKQEVKQNLEDHAKQMRKRGNSRPFKARYDCATGKYLTFEEWINLCIEKWHKLQILFVLSN